MKTKKTTETKIPLYLAIAFNHLKQAERAAEKMRSEFADVCNEHIEKGTIDTRTLGAMLIYGVERREEGYFLVEPIYDEEDE